MLRVKKLICFYNWNLAPWTSFFLVPLFSAPEKQHLFIYDLFDPWVFRNMLFSFPGFANFSGFLCTIDF